MKNEKYQKNEEYMRTILYASITTAIHDTIEDMSLTKKILLRYLV
ncbi:hypothetical protein OCHUTO_0935 [Orientia chuto str. Dubai]|uniref:Uncharacterized protein n=1 Tax=Orientia chuto str. Dubai TaxID=1359168 RepID=A0A0F3MHR5_9RICK|nr:hypothetical protein [Candidatus Orientia mediorientalis]KJV55196.1 hypothetical protein OCHUTO_0935 [Orientia chuto str. Dubai]